MRSALALAAAVTLAAGCMKPDTRGARLELADARLEIAQHDGARHVVSMTSQGVLAFDREVFATIGKDGDLRAGGAETAKLQKDGVLWVQGVRSNNVVIRPDGTFEMYGEVALTIGADGAVTGPLLASMAHPRMVTEDATVTYVGPPEARRALMTGFVAFVTGTPLQPPSPPVKK